MVNWPAIIKHADDAELTYISDQANWDNNAELHDLVFDETDILIDAAGNIYTLTDKRDNRVEPQPRGESISLTDFLGLVKAHAAQKGSCCVAKLYAPSIVEALRMVESLEDGW